MEISKYLIIGAFALVLLVGGAAALQEPNYGDSSKGAAPGSLAGRLLAIPHPISLNTVAYVERVVGANISLPDATLLGPGFRVIGAEMDRLPMERSIGNGITFRFWSVNLYITNQPFVNGSTLNTDLYPQAVIANETPAGPNSSSYKEAKDFVDPGQACVVSQGAQTTSSCTQGQGPGGQVVQIRNTYLGVHPTVPNAVFQIDVKRLVIAIYPGSPAAAGIVPGSILSYQRLLALAGSMIP